MKKGTAFLLALNLILSLCACVPAADSAPTSKSSAIPAATPAMSETSSEVASLELVTPANRVEYWEGEEFDSTGMVVNAIMEDGSIQENVEVTASYKPPLKRTNTYVRLKYGGKSVDLQISVNPESNRDEYGVAATEYVPGSPLEGKTIFWLGSSVTYGARSMEESMADYIAKRNGATCIKEAVSGTTLANTKDTSYVSRFDTYLASVDKAEQVDAVVVQLSSNDSPMPENFGIITNDDVRDADAFDNTTTFGAIEYIIATAKDTWACPIFFYTNPDYGTKEYGDMVTALEEIAEKWDVTLINMYRDTEFCAVTEEQSSFYMYDPVHPTRAGYRDWWTPYFEAALADI